MDAHDRRLIRLARRLGAITIITLLVALARPSAAGDSVAMFDGATLDGWVPMWDDDGWTVEDGAIVAKPGHGGWLRTARHYRDFELDLRFLLSPGANSGVALRASTVGDPAFTGMEVQLLDSAGQDPSDTNCGAVYDAIAPRAMAVRPAGEWNDLHVRLVGDRLTVVLNDVTIHAAEPLDERGYVHQPQHPSPLRDRLPTGHIAFQNHGQPVRFRDIRIRDLSPDPDPGGFARLTDGATLDGWFATGGATWTAEDGDLVGRDGPGHLFTARSFTDLEMRAFVRVNANGNGGFYCRAVPDPDASIPWPVGYEAQVDQHDPKNFTGCIYDRAWGPRLLTRDEAWFDYRVRAVGDHVQTWINGVPMVDAMITGFSSGHIALQSHHPGNEIRWRDVQVRELGAPIVSESFDVLVFSRTAGFRHGSIPAGIEALRGLGAARGFGVDATEDPDAFTDATLARYRVVVFLNTTGDVLDDVQQGAFERFIRAGGGYVGVHAAADTEYDWPWYGGLVAGYFNGHPRIQPATIDVEDAAHPSTRHLPGRWDRTDEWYNYRESPRERPRVRVLMRLDPTSYEGSTMPDDHPIAWCQAYDGGRAWYTGGGHTDESYSEPAFVAHLLGGIRWAAGLDD